MSETLLAIEQVGYSYGRADWRLAGIDFGVESRDFIAVVGANGSGKSTLLKIIAGILSPSEGRVLLGQRSIGDIPRRELARRIGYLPQQVNAAFDFGVTEIVAMGRFCHAQGLGLTTPQDRRIIEHCMQITETEALRDRSIAQLSGGERQRVMLASVLAQQPQIMLLDEPVTGLDLPHQVAFFKLLAQLTHRGMAVVVITHDLNLASQFCGRILFLNQGRKEIFASAEEVFANLARSPSYIADLTIFNHPQNRKPAILPYNRSFAPQPSEPPKTP